MSKETLTFALDGEIALEEFASALGNFHSLLKQLSIEAGGGVKIDWVIEELFSGSAVTTFRGVSEDVVKVNNVINAYEDVGDSLQSGRDIPFSSNVKKFATNLTGIINGRVTAIRFETPTKDFIISGRTIEGEKTTPIKYSIGTVKGTIQTLSMRKRLSFTLWDSLFDKPVSCYLKEGEEEKMRNAWGKRAVVSGKVGRQPDTGKPIVIREVKYIRILEDIEPGSYKRARGVLPWAEGDEKPEDAIRRLRNA